MSGSLPNSLPPLSERIAGLTGRGRFVVFAGTGAAGALAHPPFGVLGLGLLSLALVLAAQPWRMGARRAWWAGWDYGLGYFAVALHWIIEPFLVDIARHGWMAPFAIVLMAGGLALFWGGALALGAWRRSGLVTVLAFAGAELLRAHIFTGFPWGMHVTALVETWVYQGAAWLGPHGLTLACLLVLLLLLDAPRVALVGLPLLVLSLTLGPEATAPAEDAPVVRVVQPNAEQHLKWTPEFAPVYLSRMLEATGAAPAADLVLWPESAITTWYENGGGIYQEAATRGGGAAVLLGAQSLDAGQTYNVAGLVGSDGNVEATYRKVHLVPFGEYFPLGRWLGQIDLLGRAGQAAAGFGFSAGDGPRVMDVPGLGLVQPLICYESIFAHEVRQAPERPRLIAILTNDAWFGQWGGPAQHLQHAQARAIEMGLAVARSANTGISAIIDARGRVVASLPLGASGHVDAPLPAALPPTIYARYGNIPFALLAIVALLAVLVRRRAELD
ncbi:MAG: apolipoprotein N-acyltransferase [Pseudomonadota bacterium]